MNKIIDFKEHQKAPLVNGVIFPDGTISLLDIRVDWKPPINYTIRPLSKTSINILNDKGELSWIDCGILAKLIDEKHSIEIIAGDGNFGSDGFVGAIDINSEKLIWLAFFDCSNPFDNLKVIDDEIYATSTVGCIWKFKIQNPTECIVECR